ncbi:MAG: DivIVA domain-containing protein [Oscillospiraceae bacterium]
MTGKEILEKEFDRAGMRGYRADQVDEFLQQIAKYVDNLLHTKEDYEYKLKLLADKIEEYKKDEAVIRDAVLDSKKLGSRMVEEAKIKSEQMLNDAKLSAESMLSQAKGKIENLTKESLQKANIEINSAKRECEREQKRLEVMKKEVSNFRSSILKQYKNHLDLLSNLPVFEEKTSQQEDNSNDEKEGFIQHNIKSEISDDIKENTADIKFNFNKSAINEENIQKDDKNNLEENFEKSEKIEIGKNISVTSSDFDEDFNQGQIRPKIIRSDILEYDDDIKREVKLQTKEFNSKRNSSGSAILENKNVSPAIPFNPPKSTRGSMAEKFAELDFGKNNLEE